MRPFEAGRLYARRGSAVGVAVRNVYPSRRGGARWLLLIPLAALALLGLWFARAARSGAGDDAREALAPGTAPAAGTAQRGGDATPTEVVRAFDREEGGLVGLSPAAPESWRPDFEGEGSIRGRVLVPSDISPAPALRVIARPSRVLRGRDRARTAEVELAAGETEFRLSGLPLGGYDLLVEGQGLYGAPQPVLLVKGSADPYVTLGVHPTGFVDGFVHHADGRPALGVEVSLEPAAGGTPLTTTTGAAGEYLFENVRDGEYRIRFGPSDRPYLPVRELSFRAPSMQFTPQVLPALVDLLISVVDADDHPVEGVTIDGYGSAGGGLHTTSDHLGEARLRFLRPGRYRLTARAEDGRRAREEFELGADGPTELVMRLRR